MARSQRSARLETRTARLKLERGERHWVTISQGLALAYRRGDDGYGTWQGRVWDGMKYRYRNLGRADDHQDANGQDVLDYFQAHGKARQLYEEVTKGRPDPTAPATVAEVAEHYLGWYRQHRRAIKETEQATRAHILPALGNRVVSELTAPELRRWLERLAAKPARLRTSRFTKAQAYRKSPLTEDDKRARRATANRVFTILKAMLNKAFGDGLVADDAAWRRVKPFAKVDEPRVRFLTEAEATRLVNASKPGLRHLVQAALLTGARFGELIAMTVAEVNLKTRQIYIARSKSGRPRHVPLNDEGAELFRGLVAGKTGEALVFQKADGSAWGKNHHVRMLGQACNTAKVRPAIAFHELRHTYASHLAQAGVDLLTISKLLGHADTRITSRHYAHLADKTLALAVTKLPSFGVGGSKQLTIVKRAR